MKGRSVTERILDKALLIVLILQIAFILYMNLFRADTMIDFDSSSAYMHEMEMGSQGRIFPLEYSYQASLDLDGAALVSALLYHFTGNIFTSRGIANSLVVLLYIFVANSVLCNIGLSKRWKRFGILLFLIPYSMTILGYWRTLFAGGGFFAFRALVPLIIISLILDIDKENKSVLFFIRAALLLFIVFLTGLSSGPYILLCAVCPLLLWEFLSAFLKADLNSYRSKRTVIAVIAVIASLIGIASQKAVGFSSTADSKCILTSDKWIDAVLSSFAGIFELFGGLTIHKGVRLFSFEALGTAIDFVVTLILISAIIYTFVTCVKKKEISDMKGYIFTLMLINALMFGFLDLKYGDTVFESRYLLIPMLPSFFLLSMMMEELQKNGKLKKLQVSILEVLIVALFFASMVFGDAQWIYAKTALKSESLKELNKIIEDEGVNTAFIVGEDNKDLGRKLRVYSRDVHYIVVNDGAESAFRTTWGGTTRYVDNSMQQGKTAIIASPESYETLPEYLVSGMEYLRDHDGVNIYIADESRFDCVGGIVAAKDRVTDFPYSPGYSYDNAFIKDDGALCFNEGGGTLKSSYDSVPGTWDYTIYYDIKDIKGEAFAEIKVGNGESVRTKLDPSSDHIDTGDIVMADGEKVSFLISAPEGALIKRIEISRKK